MPTFDKLPGIIQGDVSGQDILALQDGGQTKKITLAMLSQYLGTAGVEGSHILRIELTSAAPAGRAGVTDTYTITFREEDGTEGTATFEVRNGSDGQNGGIGPDGLPVDNVSVVGTPQIGDPTVLKFFVNGTQVGEDITIPAGQRGLTGAGWTSETNYDHNTGIITFVSEDGLGFQTDDLRGAASTEAGPQGAYYVKLFLRAATQPNTPTDVTWTPGTGRGTLSGANSANWTLTPTSGTIQLWEVEALFNPDGAQDIATWSAVFHAGAEGPVGPKGEGLEVSSYDTTTDTTKTTVSLQGKDSGEAAGTFDVLRGEKGETGGPGIKGDPGAPVDNVVIDHSAGPGGTTIIHFEVEDEQVGSQVNIPPGERGSTGPKGDDGDPGESLKVERTEDISNGELEVFLETETSEQPAGSFIVPRGPEGVQGISVVSVFADSELQPTAPPSLVGGWNISTNTFTVSAVTALNTAGWFVEPPTTTTETLWESRTTIDFTKLQEGATALDLTFGTAFEAGAAGPEGPRGEQGAQGFFTQYAYIDSDGDPGAVPTTEGLVAPDGGWSFTVPPTPVHDIWITTVVYNPASPDATLTWSTAFRATGTAGPKGEPGNVGPGIIDAEVVAGELTFTGSAGYTGNLGPFQVRGEKGDSGEQYDFQNSGNVTFNVIEVEDGNDMVSANADVTGGYDLIATAADGGDLTISADNAEEEVNRLATTDYTQTELAKKVDKPSGIAGTNFGGHYVAVNSDGATLDHEANKVHLNQAGDGVIINANLDVTGDIEANVGTDGSTRSFNAGTDVHFTEGTVSYLQGDTSAKKVYYDPTNASGGVTTSDANEIATIGDLTSGYTPLNPSGGSGTTTDPAYRGTQTTNPGAFVPNNTGYMSEVEGENAHDGQDFLFTYTDPGQGVDIWAVINLPNDLTNTHTVGFNYRDRQSGQIVVVTDFNTYAGSDYTTYTMSFGATVDIITHIS